MGSAAATQRALSTLAVVWALAACTGSSAICSGCASSSGDHGAVPSPCDDVDEIPLGDLPEAEIPANVSVGLEAVMANWSEPFSLELECPGEPNVSVEMQVRSPPPSDWTFIKVKSASPGAADACKSALVEGSFDVEGASFQGEPVRLQDAPVELSIGSSRAFASVAGLAQQKQAGAWPTLTVSFGVRREGGRYLNLIFSSAESEAGGVTTGNDVQCRSQPEAAP
jgi:hypothetical protein